MEAGSKVSMKEMTHIPEVRAMEPMIVFKSSSKKGYTNLMFNQIQLYES